MKKIKILGVVLLLAVTITTFALLNADTVTISSKGRANVTINGIDGTIHYWCDNSDSVDCKITIEMKPPVN